MSWGGFLKIVLGGEGGHHSIKSHVLGEGGGGGGGAGRSVATSYITVLGVVYISCWIIIVLGGVVWQYYGVTCMYK